MKKLFIALCFLAMGYSASFAQLQTPIDHTFEFVNDSKNGNIIENGTIINISNVETSDDGISIRKFINSGLYVKNTTGEIAYGGLLITIENLPSGMLSHCWPSVCQNYTQDYLAQNGNVINRDPARVQPSTEGDQSLQSEWYISEGQYGTCTVSYQFKVYTIDKDFNYTPKGDGPKVTVNYIYSNPNGINSNVASKQLKSIAYFDLSGREVKNPVQGVFVKKLVYADGTTRTVKEYKK